MATPIIILTGRYSGGMTKEVIERENINRNILIESKRISITIVEKTYDLERFSLREKRRRTRHENVGCKFQRYFPGVSG